MKKLIIIFTICTFCTQVMAQVKVGETSTGGGVLDILSAPDSLVLRLEAKLHEIDSLSTVLIIKAEDKKKITTERYQKEYITSGGYKFTREEQPQDADGYAMKSIRLWVNNSLYTMYPVEKGRHNWWVTVDNQKGYISYHGALGVQNDVGYFEADKGVSVNHFFKSINNLKLILTTELAKL